MQKHGISVERSDDRVRVTVPMPLPYLPVPYWLTPAGEPIGCLIMLPFALAWVVLRTLFPLKPPPRAQFDVSADKLMITFWSRERGERTFVEYPLASIAEIRKNRFGAGLWVHAQGINQETYLTDLPDDVIQSLAETLAELTTPAVSPAPGKRE